MIAVREMCEKDIEAVSALEAEVFSRPWSSNAFLAALHAKNAVFLIAEEAGDIFGYIGMYFAVDEGEITNVAVSPGRRTQGIGTSLIHEMIRQAKRRALANLVLEVRVSNDAAVGLYEKNGFVKLGIRKGFYDLPKEDAYLMRRCISKE
ncbi:MAG: ribosomal protein S18-alanine N-acetyltransferase [Clostridiales bacterium]|nr:ribosomal protein S18-alanine N-acetyltransferase [Clostridiales bacterium]